MLLFKKQDDSEKENGKRYMEMEKKNFLNFTQEISRLCNQLVRCQIQCSLNVNENFIS